MLRLLRSSRLLMLLSLFVEVVEVIKVVKVVEVITDVQVVEAYLIFVTSSDGVKIFRLVSYGLGAWNTSQNHRP